MNVNFDWNHWPIFISANVLAGKTKKLKWVNTPAWVKIGLRLFLGCLDLCPPCFLGGSDFGPAGGAHSALFLHGFIRRTKQLAQFLFQGSDSFFEIGGLPQLLDGQIIDGTHNAGIIMHHLDGINV